MDAHAARLRAWLAERAVDAEHLVFALSTHSVAEAAAAASAREEEFVKTILMLAGDELVAAIVKGEDRASTSRVAKLLGAPTVRLATAEEMLARTGYPAGGTPPFGFDARFLVDERVLDREVVYAGGGSDRALVRVAPAEMLRANGGRIVRVRK